MGNKLVEVENELKAIEEIAINERNANKNNDSSHEDDSDDDVMGAIGN